MNSVRESRVTSALAAKLIRRVTQQSSKASPEEDALKLGAEIFRELPADAFRFMEKLTCVMPSLDELLTTPALRAAFDAKVKADVLDTLRELEELAAGWASRQYNYINDRNSAETFARYDGKEDAFREAADDLRDLLKRRFPK